jgi:hypothetical protein
VIVVVLGLAVVGGLILFAVVAFFGRSPQKN